MPGRAPRPLGQLGRPATLEDGPEQLRKSQIETIEVSVFASCPGFTH